MSEPQGECVFAEHAPALRMQGFAVIPVRDKRPLIKGFSDWRGAPSPRTVEKWRGQFVDADVAYLPQKTVVDEHRRWRIVVIDADDTGTAQQVGDLIGRTPGMVRTRRGAHFLYRINKDDAERLECLLGRRSDLRFMGLNADIKFRHYDIVILPPSRHPADPAFRYSWQACDPSVIRDLLPFPVTLFEQIVVARKVSDQPVTMRRLAEQRAGSRGLGLNDHLVLHGAHVEVWEELLDLAHEYNEALIDQGLEPLPEEEVVRRAGAVWADVLAGKIDVMHGRRNHRAPFTADEIDDLLRAYGAQTGNAAIVLLLKCRLEHAGRAARGESFAISDSSMHEAQTLPGWGRDRLRSAREALLGVGREDGKAYLECVEPGRRWHAGRYRLIAQEVGASLARRRKK